MRQKCFVKSGANMGIEFIHQQRDELSIWIAFLYQVAHTF